MFWLVIEMDEGEVVGVGELVCGGICNADCPHAVSMHSDTIEQVTGKCLGIELGGSSISDYVCDGVSRAKPVLRWPLPQKVLVGLLIQCCPCALPNHQEIFLRCSRLRGQEYCEELIL